jgi:hypothetical protein
MMFSLGVGIAESIADEGLEFGERMCGRSCDV